MMKYDVIVAGGGHAGIEASFSAAKLGTRVLLATLDIDAVGKLSCNPAIGGISKGHLVKEVDALGGLIAKIADRCAVSYRRLNKSKGKAVWATRAQVDRFLYPKVARDFLEKEGNIDILETEVARILIKGKKVVGIETNFGEIFASKAVIICAGTFLKGKIHIGLKSFSGGRLYEPSSDSLFESIKKLGFKVKHFKTGTCARLDKRTIDFSKMIEQSPEYDVEPFSFSNDSVPSCQLSCFITYTNKRTHKIIINNMDRSPLYTGKIKAQGVRYCPSLEDKIVKFSHKDRHQIFIEPEGWESIEIYPNGISTSLPFDVQIKFIHTIEGLENAKILRPGYGIEHGLIDSRQLYHTLESKIIEGLFFAGQVNGTTGYEEAAAQGIIAGINAALKVKKEKPFILNRETSFIGVLIDDLVTKGTDEPYRMFTSRSELRLSIRESNADLRLGKYAHSLGLISKEAYEAIVKKNEQINKEIRKLKATKILFEWKKQTLYDVIKMPKTSYKDFVSYVNQPIKDTLVEREVEILIKYEGFLKREEQSLKIFDSFKKIRIPADINFNLIPSLSKEIKDKLSKFKPKNLDEALKISGVTPAAVLHICNYIERKKKGGKRGFKAIP